MIVNYANAEKLSGKKDKAMKILDEEDWTGLSVEFDVCVAAVKDDVDAVIKNMKAAATSGKMKSSYFREWPVFYGIKSDPRFIEAFEQVFGEKFVEEKKSTTVKDNDNAGDAGSDGSDESPEADGLGGTIH